MGGAHAMRRCPVCGVSLAGRHPDARTCSAACRREAGRFRAVLAGRGDGPYGTLADLGQRSRRGVQIAVSGRYDAAIYQVGPRA
jgi:hypothetical protein